MVGSHKGWILSDDIEQYFVFNTHGIFCTDGLHSSCTAVDLVKSHNTFVKKSRIFVKTNQEYFL